jgi:hypothetical protein
MLLDACGLPSRSFDFVMMDARHLLVLGAQASEQTSNAAGARHHLEA